MTDHEESIEAATQVRRDPQSRRLLKLSFGPDGDVYAGKVFPESLRAVLEAEKQRHAKTAVDMVRSVGALDMERTFAGSDAAKLLLGVTSPRSTTAISNFLAGQKRATEMLKAFGDESATAVAARQLAGMNLDGFSNLVQPRLMSDLNSLADGVKRLDFGVVPAPRRSSGAIAPTRSVPVRERSEVRRFVERTHPEALRMLDGIYDVEGSRNAVGASAYSATELMKLILFSLVSQADVARFAASMQVRRQKRHVYELIALTYAGDVNTLMALTDEGALSDNLQSIKHNWHEIGWDAAEERLAELIDQVESLLVYLAQTISR